MRMRFMLSRGEQLKPDDSSSSKAWLRPAGLTRHAAVSASDRHEPIKVAQQPPQTRLLNYLHRLREFEPAGFPLTLFAPLLALALHFEGEHLDFATRSRPILQ